MVLGRAMTKTHSYRITTEWTGNLGAGTANYRAYSRNHRISATEKTAPIHGSADPYFRGDGAGYNPEELLVASLSSCHMLVFLSLAAKRGFVVDSYRDEAVGVLAKDSAGKLAMTRVTLHPQVEFGGEKRPTADELAAMHHDSHEQCFIASSVKTDVLCEPLRSLRR